jgi:hypothetical protein
MILVHDSLALFLWAYGELVPHPWSVWWSKTAHLLMEGSKREQEGRQSSTVPFKGVHHMTQWSLSRLHFVKLHHLPIALLFGSTGDGVLIWGSGSFPNSLAVGKIHFFSIAWLRYFLAASCHQGLLLAPGGGCLQCLDSWPPQAGHNMDGGFLSAQSGNFSLTYNLTLLCYNGVFDRMRL